MRSNIDFFSNERKEALKNLGVVIDSKDKASSLRDFGQPDLNDLLTKFYNIFNLKLYLNSSTVFNNSFSQSDFLNKDSIPAFTLVTRGDVKFVSKKPFLTGDFFTQEGKSEYEFIEKNTITLNDDLIKLLETDVSNGFLLEDPFKNKLLQAPTEGQKRVGWFYKVLELFSAQENELKNYAQQEFQKYEKKLIEDLEKKQSADQEQQIVLSPRKKLPKNYNQVEYDEFFQNLLNDYQLFLQYSEEVLKSFLDSKFVKFQSLEDRVGVLESEFSPLKEQYNALVKAANEAMEIIKILRSEVLNGNGTKFATKEELAKDKNELLNLIDVSLPKTSDAIKEISGKFDELHKELEKKIPESINSSLQEWAQNQSNLYQELQQSFQQLQGEFTSFSGLAQEIKSVKDQNQQQLAGQNEEIANLKTSVENLKLELEERFNTSYTEVSNQYNQKLTDIAAQYNSFFDKANKKIGALGSLEKGFGKLKSEVDKKSEELKQEVEGRLSEIGRLSLSSDSHKSEDLESKIEALNSELEKLKQENEEVKKSLEDKISETRKEASDHVNSELKKREDAFSQELKLYKEGIINSSQDNQNEFVKNLQARKLDLENQIKEKSEQIDNLAKYYKESIARDFGKTIAKIIEIDSKITEYQELHQTNLEAQNAAFLAGEEKIQNLVKSANQGISATGEDLEKKIQETHQDGLSQIDQAKNSAINDIRSFLQSESEKIRQQTSELSSTLDKKLSKKEGEITDYFEAAVRVAQEKATEIQSETLGEISKSKDSALEEIASKGRENLNLIDEASKKALEEYGQAKAQSEKIISSLEELRSYIQNLGVGNFGKLSSKIDLLVQNQNKGLEQNFEKLGSQIQQFQNQLDGYKAELENVKNDATQAKENSENAQKLIENLRQELSGKVGLDFSNLNEEWKNSSEVEKSLLIRINDLETSLSNILQQNQDKVSSSQVNELVRNLVEQSLEGLRDEIKSLQTSQNPVQTSDRNFADDQNSKITSLLDEKLAEFTEVLKALGEKNEDSDKKIEIIKSLEASIDEKIKNLENEKLITDQIRQDAINFEVLKRRYDKTDELITKLRLAHVKNTESVSSLVEVIKNFTSANLSKKVIKNEKKDELDNFEFDDNNELSQSFDLDVQFVVNELFNSGASDGNYFKELSSELQKIASDIQNGIKIKDEEIAKYKTLIDGTITKLEEKNAEILAELSSLKSGAASESQKQKIEHLELKNQLKEIEKRISESELSEKEVLELRALVENLSKEVSNFNSSYTTLHNSHSVQLEEVVDAQQAQRNLLEKHDAKIKENAESIKKNESTIENLTKQIDEIRKSPEKLQVVVENKLPTIADVDFKYKKDGAKFKAIKTIKNGDKELVVYQPKINKENLTRDRNDRYNFSAAGDFNEKADQEKFELIKNLYKQAANAFDLELKTAAMGLALIIKHGGSSSFKKGSDAEKAFTADCKTLGISEDEITKINKCSGRFFKLAREKDLYTANESQLEKLKKGEISIDKLTPMRAKRLTINYSRDIFVDAGGKLQDWINNCEQVGVTIDEISKPLTPSSKVKHASAALQKEESNHKTR